jgi:hypothetical protein
MEDDAQPLPDPNELLESALNETPSDRLLRRYSETIRVLKQQKKFTFREIAVWLTKRGVPTDHNAVWREYTRHISDSQAHEVLAHDDEVEERESVEEALREH